MLHQQQTSICGPAQKKTVQICPGRHDTARSLLPDQKRTGRGGCTPRQQKNRRTGHTLHQQQILLCAPVHKKEHSHTAMLPFQSANYIINQIYQHIVRQK